MVDPIPAVVSLLKAAQPVTELAQGRVFGVELPLAEAKAMPRKAVVIQPSGGAPFPVGSADFIPHQAERFDAYCYGETPIEAQKLRRAVHDVFKYMRRHVRAGVLLHWINPAGGSMTLRDPDTKWPAAWQSWQIFFAEDDLTEA